MGRILAKALKGELGVPVIVTNRSGAGGSVGATFLKKSKPDGYTIMMGGDDIPTLNPTVQQVEFTKEDFIYLAAIAEYQSAIVCLPEKPYKTLPELVEYSKAHPGEISCAVQTPVDRAIISNIIKIKKLDWKLVSTKGGGEASQLLFGKKVDISYSGGFHSKHGDRLIVLVSLNKGRLAGAPDKPSLQELGYKMALPSYVTFIAPKGIHAEAAEILEKAIFNASQSADFKKLVEERLKSPVIKVTSKDLEKHIPLLEGQLSKMLK